MYKNVQSRIRTNLLSVELITVIYSPVEYYTAILNYMKILEKIMLNEKQQVLIYT